MIVGTGSEWSMWKTRDYTRGPDYQLEADMQCSKCGKEIESGNTTWTEDQKGQEKRVLCDECLKEETMPSSGPINTK
jgi:DNA-directed RNA polymerase subunit RPC12/RpoP